MDKLSRFDDEYPGQRAAQPFGNPPQGFWSDPEVKEGAEQGISLNDAVKHFISNPKTIGKPIHVDINTKTVELDNGSYISFDDVMTEYKKAVANEKTSDYGFIDGPGDVGKDPKGDFPSMIWMPRGTEDEDVDSNVDLASLGLSKLDKTADEDPLAMDQKEQIAAEYGAEYNSAVDHYAQAIKNGHPQDRALAYAVSEMSKVGITISPTILLEVTKTYLG